MIDSAWVGGNLFSSPEEPPHLSRNVAGHRLAHGTGTHYDSALLREHAVIRLQCSYVFTE